jgi:hypothetical protein
MASRNGGLMGEETGVEVEQQDKSRWEEMGVELVTAVL